MGSPPLRAKLLYLVVSEPVRVEFAPGIDAAHVAEGEITDFADSPFRTVLRVRTGRDSEDTASSFTIRFICGIACRVESSIAVEFPASSATQANTLLSISLKSAPINVCPGAAVTIARLQPPTTARGLGYKRLTC